VFSLGKTSRETRPEGRKEGLLALRSFQLLLPHSTSLVSEGKFAKGAWGVINKFIAISRDCRVLGSSPMKESPSSLSRFDNTRSARRLGSMFRSEHPSDAHSQERESKRRSDSMPARLREVKLGGRRRNRSRGSSSSKLILISRVPRRVNLFKRCAGSPKSL